jgi:hypothetical protein
MTTLYKYVSPEHNYTVFLNSYFVGIEAFEIAKLKCRRAGIRDTETRLIFNYGYGIWLKKVFPDEFKQGVKSYRNLPIE